MKHGFVKLAAASPEIKLGRPLENARVITEMACTMAAAGAKIGAFPELCVTGYTLEDLFAQSALLESAERAVEEIIKQTAQLDLLFAVGVPVARGAHLYNCAAVICRGRLLALVPKTHIPNHSEFYEARRFSPLRNGESCTIRYASQETLLCSDVLFRCSDMPEICVGVELCEDLWVTTPRCTQLCEAGASIMLNLSASNELIGKAGYRSSMIKETSGRLYCAYCYAGAGEGESTTDLVFSGHIMIAENGSVLSEQRWTSGGITYGDADVCRIFAERRRTTTYLEKGKMTELPFELNITQTRLDRTFPRTPFVPSEDESLGEVCSEILQIQSVALKTRLNAVKCSTAVLGLSGGLDSTLALLVTVRAFDMLGWDRKRIISVTMPCFGTTERTKGNAEKLAECLGTELRTIGISRSVLQHFEDIGQDSDKHDVTYENSQARERTQVLMDIANMTGGIVIGTGDLSEIALGWSTYNGDHMSMYAVNCSIPKTLVRYLVRYTASISEDTLKAVLLDVLDTPVSPELLPPENGVISQETESIVGPYELHDFFLYYTMRFGFPPDKVYRIAKQTFGSSYDNETILKWLRFFIKRFFTQQFKRSCIPDGPKVGTVALSPRGDWRMPSDIYPEQWLSLLDNIKEVF